MDISTSTIIRPLPDCLTPAQQWTLLEWAHLISHIETEAELKEFLDSVLKKAPSEHIVLALGRIDQEQKLQRLERVFNISYPSDWMSEYVQENYAQNDPILRVQFGYAPVIWQEHFMRSKSKRERKFIAEASAIGLGIGITLTSASRHNNLGCLFSLAGEEAVQNTNNFVSMLNGLMPHLHQAMVRIASLPPTAPSSLPLSQREYDIFHWMSKGKTNWEIAIILDISERTVKFHVANIIRKLSANNRTHAIVLGMHLLPISNLTVSEA
ncbi:LuxR C-terminal-related transcriptional regulator [Neisseriaceae bacterium TC5R-5]|nr:LuxR C-terminal-related transcriptional regulator [Neisseriaceae bacterium TC5R-5]